MEVSAQLREAIEGLYRAFAAYPLPKDTGACPCCHSEQDERQLHAKLLRELEPKHLGKYAAEALLVWGDENAYRHFLPRIFELVATLPNASLELVDLEMVLSRLRLGAWWTWPKDEQSAVRNFLHALWTDALTREPEDVPSAEIEEWVCSIAQAEPSLDWYTDHWIDTNDEQPLLHLAKLVIYTDILKSGSSHTQSFWIDAREQYDQLRTWIRSEAVKVKLRFAAERWPSDVTELAVTVLD